MKIRKILLGTLLLVLGLPVALVLTAVVSISLLDRSNGTMTSSGVEREYLLHVPASYDGATATPLVISLHAGATWPAQQENLSRWSSLADEEGFIVVYPAGTGGVTSGLDVPRVWHVDRGPGRARDVTFVSELIDRLEATYNVDPTRIFVNGMSNGGGMAFVLSCSLSHRIAAVGTVSAAHSLPFEWCSDSRPVPLIAFHGDDDPICPYEGGRLRDPFNPVKPVYPPVEEFTASWARRNGCEAEPVASKAAAGVARLRYRNCADDAAVVLYTIEGGGHTWPGGKPLPEWRVGANSTSVDATRRMWAFFEDHPLR